MSVHSQNFPDSKIFDIKVTKDTALKKFKKHDKILHSPFLQFTDKTIIMSYKLRRRNLSLFLFLRTLFKIL